MGAGSVDGHDIRPSSPGRSAGRRREVTVAANRCSFRLLPALVLVALLGACSSWGDRTSPPPDATPHTGTRTLVEFGPDAVATAEIVRVGDDARATVRLPEGLVGGEILVGRDHYVLLPGAEQTLGLDRWIHTDLTDPDQRRFHAENPVGFVAMADLADLRPGDEFSGEPVLEVRDQGEGEVLIDLGHGQTIEIVTETIVGPDPIVAPAPEEVVDLVDLPSVVELPSMLDRD